MTEIKVQYKIDFDEMKITLYLEDSSVPFRYGSSLKYRGLYENHNLKELRTFLNQTHASLYSYCQEKFSKTHNILELTEEEKSHICLQVINKLV